MRAAPSSMRPGRLALFPLALAGLLSGLFAGCGGPSQASKKSVNALLASQNFTGAEAKIKASKDKEYGKKNAVLYYLDMGTVLHDAGRYKESDESLDKAEARMKELYTKSVSKSAGTLVLNDNTVDYPGEPFERALTHVFRALNYVFLGQSDEAVVEARKVEQYLSELHALRERKSVYKDDAFARYLDSLLYADIGKMDDARISFKAAQAAYKWYASDYNTPEPRFDLGPKDSEGGELVFIHYNGTAPRKVTKTFQVAWGQGLAAIEATKGDDEETARAQNAIRGGLLGNQITVAYPAYQQDPFKIAASEVAAAGKSAATVLMEDVGAIAAKDLSDRVALIKTRAIARATVKFILAKAAGDAVTKKYGKGWGLAAKMVASGVAAATEIADTRGWATVPSQIRMARMRLPAGVHEVKVDFKDGTGRTVSSKVFKDVKIEKSRRTYLHARTAA